MKKYILILLIVLILLIALCGFLIYMVVLNNPPSYNASIGTIICEAFVDDVPKEVITGYNYTLFLYNSGEVKSVHIKKGSLNSKLLVDSVAKISIEDECIAVLDVNNHFYFINADELSGKNEFAEIVNEKAATNKVMEISSSNNFTVVLFDDGTVYSDIQIQNNTVLEENQCKYIVFEDYNIKHVFTSEYQIAAIDCFDKVHYGYWLPNQQQAYKQMKIENGQIITNVAFGYECYVLTSKGDVFEFEDIYTEFNTIEGKKKENFKKIVDMRTTDRGGLLIYDNNNLYYRGVSYVQSKDNYYGIDITSDYIFQSDQIVHFWGGNDGIYVMTKDGKIHVVKC